MHHEAFRLFLRKTVLFFISFFLMKADRMLCKPTPNPSEEGNYRLKHLSWLVILGYQFPSSEGLGVGTFPRLTQILILTCYIQLIGPIKAIGRRESPRRAVVFDVREHSV